MLIRQISSCNTVPWCLNRLEETWGSRYVARRGELIDASLLPALLAYDSAAADLPTGMAAFKRIDKECEVVVLDVEHKHNGCGTALLEALIQTLLAEGVNRIWLTTTNDNLDAMRFYMRRGFRMSTVYKNGVDYARELKPSIPQFGNYNIEMHDEIEFELII